MTTIAQDTFTRANQSGFGTASGGGTWTTQFSSPTLSIASNEGKATGLAGNDWMAYLGPTTTDCDETVRCTISDFGNDGVGIYARYVDANNWYRIFIYGSSVAVDKKVSGVFAGTVASSAFSPTNNTFYWLKIHLSGSTLQVKVWSGTLGSEPASWAITTTMSGISGAGHVGIGAYHNASGDASQFDNFVATDAASAPTVVTGSVSSVNANTSGQSIRQLITSAAAEQNSSSATITYIRPTVSQTISSLNANAGQGLISQLIQSLAQENNAGQPHITQLVQPIARESNSSTCTALSFPVGSSSDPDAQMLYGDLLLEYAVLRASAANAQIAKIGIALYPPERVTNEYAVPGYLAVRLVGENWTQHHKLRTINDVNAFIAAHS